MDLSTMKQLMQETMSSPDLDQGPHMVLEGRLLVERQIQAGRPLDALACVPALAADMEALTGGSCPIHVLKQAELETLAGYHFHRGILAFAPRPELMPLSQWFRETPNLPHRMVICPRLGDPANLGSLYRNASGFGWSAMAIGPRCCSPFGRKALRVSMGAALLLPTLVVDSPEDLRILDQAGFLVVATTLARDAVPLDQLAVQIEALQTIQPEALRIALVFGHEYEGLSDDWLSACAAKCIIPMEEGHDSLNVALASGIFMSRLRTALRPASSAD